MPPRASVIALIHLDHDSPATLRAQVYDRVRGLIVAGHIARGACLPSTRVLAAGQVAPDLVADGGGSLDYTGELRDGAMRFQGWTINPQGARVLQKLTFFAIAKNTVRQLFESSTNSGKTWQPGFDGRHIRRKP